MAIPKAQLDTWSAQGSITGSRNTYNSIKSVLESPDAPYANRNFTVFLQGSYGNDTNIYAESDVDIVIQLTSSFHYGLEQLSFEQKSLFQQAHSGNVNYGLNDFKREVLVHLTNKYGATSVISGDKAINISANVNRRKADVIVCMGYRKYYKFINEYNQYYEEGISFFNSVNTRIDNYPKLHSTNATTKHQNTSSWYKPTVRVFKNIRGKLIAEGMINAGDAPSYFIEGMLYNVPNASFGRSFDNTVVNSLNWLSSADKSKLVCANEQYHLLNEESPVTWRANKYSTFIKEACDLWQQW